VVDTGKHKVGNKKPKGVLEAQIEKLKLLNRNELKHDVKFLNMATELRQKADEGDKQAKKVMKLKMKHEALYEE
jgi:predicted NBD/HSP70 family sugar kinase